MAVIGLAVGVPVTIAVRSDGDAEPRSDQPSISQRLPLNPPVGDSRIEAAYQVPKGWKLDRAGDALTLASGDGAVQVGITRAGPVADADEIFDAALAEIKSLYDDVVVERSPRTKVGGRAAEQAVVSATREGRDLRILVAVPEGDEDAYLLEVLTTAAAPKRVAEAQRFLNSLELEG